jgi:hypothetical protein
VVPLLNPGSLGTAVTANTPVLVETVAPLPGGLHKLGV